MAEMMMERTGQTEAGKAPALTKGASIWDSSATMATAVRMAEYLARAKIIPQAYQNNPGDCLVAIDLGRRMGLSPVTVMQNSQIVRGNFSWKGSFCKALVGMSGKFQNARYEFRGTPGKMDWGCRLVAESAATHRTIHGVWVTMQMAKDEEWLDKSGSKWRTMPELMLRYRAAAFFARTECPEILSGFHTSDEIIDISGDDYTVVDAGVENVEHPDIKYERADDHPQVDESTGEVTKTAPSPDDGDAAGGLNFDAL